MTTARPSSPRSVLQRVARTLRNDTPPAAASTPGPSYGPQGIPGRLVRVVPDRPQAEELLDREGTDPAEVAAVRAGWQLLDAYERLTRRGADQVFGAELEAWFDYAFDTITELNYTLSTGKELVPENRKNRLRFRRTVDFARQGEVVFDVGFGRGLLAAQLIKDRGVRKYFGIDIVDRYVPIATDLFAVNGLAPETLNLQTADLYELTKEDIASTGATFVICCEVLEHVPDAERALKVLADALPDGADLLFSVPMHGRIEGAWGHVSVFDVARLKGMLDGAGLYAHHVEPLANAWSLVVASKDPAGSQRVREATSRPPRRVSRSLSAHRDFVYLKSDELLPVGSADVTVKTAPTARVGFADGEGVAFPVTGIEAMRLWFKPTDTTHLKRLVVTAYAGDERVARWTWKVKPGHLKPGVVVSTALRPGEIGLHFVSGEHDGAERADRVEVVGEVAEGQTVRTEFRAAYLP